MIWRWMIAKCVWDEKTTLGQYQRYQSWDSLGDEYRLRRKRRVKEIGFQLLKEKRGWKIWTCYHHHSDCVFTLTFIMLYITLHYAYIPMASSRGAVNFPWLGCIGTWLFCPTTSTFLLSLAAFCTDVMCHHVMRPASQCFFIQSCIYLRILILSYLNIFSNITWH